MSFISISVRRLHDIGMSGWWSLTYLIGGIGFYIITETCTDEGQKGPNKYGPDPKEEKQKIVKKNNFFGFKDRMKRKEYIVFTIINIFLYFLLVFVIFYFFSINNHFNYRLNFLLITLAYFPVYLLLSQPIIIRRQNDIGIKNNYTDLFFYLFFPSFGLIIIFFIIYIVSLAFIKGREDSNKFSSD